LHIQPPRSLSDFHKYIRTRLGENEAVTTHISQVACSAPNRDRPAWRSIDLSPPFHVTMALVSRRHGILGAVDLALPRLPTTHLRPILASRKMKAVSLLAARDSSRYPGLAHLISPCGRLSLHYINSVRDMGPGPGRALIGLLHCCLASLQGSPMTGQQQQPREPIGARHI
jgi:hypothetical protein